MPKRTDLKSILILGAGPIVIGQACEFDYSGTQACRALRQEGYRVILVNSNPATIMTDPNIADATYIEPIHWRVVEKIIAKERPDAVLPTMGGQTALNCALDLERHGVLAKYNVEMIGANADTIDKAENRERFDAAMKKIGLECPRAGIAHSLEEAWEVQEKVGFPCIIRPSFTMGGTGGGIAYNPEEFEAICIEKTSGGVYGWAIPNLYSITKDIFLSMLMQDGTDMLDENNNAIFNNDVAVRWLTKLHDWKYNDKISPESVGNSGDLTLFNNGKSVFYFDGPWQINTLKDISTIDFGVAPMPGSVGENGTSYTGSHQFTLVECTTENTQIREACYTFINYVNQNPLSWAEAGQVTAYTPVHETEEYKALTELQPFTEEAEKAQMGNVDYEYYYDCYNYVGSAVASCLNDPNADPKTVLDDYVNRFSKFLKEQ